MRIIHSLLITATAVLAWWLLLTLAYELASRTTPRCP